MELRVKKISESTGHNSAIYGLCSYKPGYFLTGGGEGWIAEWNLKEPDNGILFATVPTSIYTLHYLEKEDIILAGDRDGGIHWIDKNKQSNDVFAHKNGVYGIYEIGGFIYTIGGDGYLTKWDIESQKQIESIQFSHSALRSLTVSPEGDHIYIGSSDGFIHKYDLSNSRKGFSNKAHEGAVFSLALNNNREILSGGKDALLKVHEQEPPKMIASINAHWYAIYSIKLYPTGLFFATASRDKSIRLWDSISFEPITTLDYASHQGHVRSVNNLLWMEDGKYLISVSDDRKVIIWDFEVID